ncbi:MAG TPA: hypothetical protein VJ964_10935 [Balneolaceae bacterium]|nr:hypothetical protein [Balneolaceae bacterium]
MISSKVHGNLDYITALFFLAAPSLFSLSQAGTILAYTLAIVHFLMTIFTGFSMGLVKLIPFSFHGYVELVTGLILIVVPWILADFFSKTDELLFTICGVVILAVWFLSDYQSPVKQK